MLVLASVVNAAVGTAIVLTTVEILKLAMYPGNASTARVSPPNPQVVELKAPAPPVVLVTLAELTYKASAVPFCVVATKVH
jgi:hypothetical protein